MKTSTTIGLLVGGAVLILAASPKAGAVPGQPQPGGILNPFNWFNGSMRQTAPAGQIQPSALTPAAYGPYAGQGYSPYGAAGNGAGYSPYGGGYGGYATPGGGYMNLGSPTYGQYLQAGYSPYAVGNYGVYGSPIFSGGANNFFGGSPAYGGAYQQAGYDPGLFSYSPAYSPIVGAPGYSPNFQSGAYANSPYFDGGGVGNFLQSYLI